MTDLHRFTEDFKTWASSASLPELDYALSILLLEIAARGPLASRYIVEHTSKSLLAVIAQLPSQR